MTVVVVARVELAVIVFTAPPDGVTRRRPIGGSPLRANTACLSNRPYRLLTQAPQAGPSGDLTRAHPIAPSPLRGKCCAFVQSPYKPSGALTRSHEAAQVGDGTPHPHGVRRMSQGQGGCVSFLHGAACIICVGRAACQATRSSPVSIHQLQQRSRGKLLDYPIMKYKARKNKTLRTSTTAESREEIAGGSETVSPRRS